MPEDYYIEEIEEDVRLASKLLNYFRKRLDTSLVDQLVPEVRGVPFIHFQNDSPQLASIKKLINCFYYAENAMEADKKRSYIKPQHLGTTISQVSKAISMVDESMPEFRWVLLENYHLIAPLYSKTLEVIKDSGWVAEFSQMERTEQASKVMSQAIGLLGPDQTRWNEENPLLATFDKIAQLMALAARSQDDGLTQDQKEQRIAQMRAILLDLEHNVLINQLSMRDFEDSKAIQDLLVWFKNIQEDGFAYTRQSLETYLSWSTTYLPRLIQLTDRLERQNYLKSGYLSNELCAKADSLGKQINDQLDADTVYGISGRVPTISSLKTGREEQIHLSQTNSVRAIITIEKQLAAAQQFYDIVRANTGKPFARITETDRIRLRQLYPQIQTALAHANLNLEHQVVDMLNATGPADAPGNSSWWNTATGGMSYLSGFIVNSDCDALSGTENAVTQFMLKTMESEQFRLKLAEKKRAELNEQLVPSLDEATQMRMETIRATLNEQVAATEAPPQVFVTVKPQELTNLYGLLSYLQEKQLSVSVHETRLALDELISRHLAEQRTQVGTSSHLMVDNYPELNTQIEHIKDCLRELEETTHAFEQLNLNHKFGLVYHVESYVAMGKAAANLASSLAMLTPNTERILGALTQRMASYSSDVSSENTPTRPQIESSPVPFELEYANNINETRANLLRQFQTTLSAPLAAQLIPQEQGVPFIVLTQDPPQIVAIKNLMNSLYYAEAGIKIWYGMNKSTAIAKAAAAHHGIAALSQVFKAANLFTDASSEIQNLMRENFVLLEPVLDGANQLIAQSGWTPQFNQLDVTKKAGSLLGQGLSHIQTRQNRTQSASVVKVLSDIPGLLHNISHLLDPNSVIDKTASTISQSQIDAIGSLLEKEFTFVNTLINPQALWALYTLYNKVLQEIPALKESTIRTYQRWLKRGYPDLLKMLDAVEVSHYLKPETLTGRIILEIDLFSDKLNQTIESMPKSKLKKIDLSYDMLEMRTIALTDLKKRHFFAILELEEQQNVADTFFTTLSRYNDQSLATISPEDLATLRTSFARIQMAMANNDLDLTNKWIATLNALTNNEPVQHPEIAKILAQKAPVMSYLDQCKNAYHLKIDVINDAIKHLRTRSLLPETEPAAQETIDDFRAEFQATTRENEPVIGVLEPIQAESLHSVRGNISYIQKLKCSALITDIKNQFSQITATSFSARIQDKLIKPAGQSLFTIADDDPLMVRQIKEVENSLAHLETAFLHFESMQKKDKLVSQAKALVEITHEAQQLAEVIDNLSSELKTHYGPLTEQLSELAHTIKTLGYNQHDWDELVYIAQHDWDELVYIAQYTKNVVTRRTPKDIRLETAFIQSERFKAQIPIDESRPIYKKAAFLAIKYSHLASPELEKTLDGLRSRYPSTKFKDKKPVIRNYTREHLANRKEMIDRASLLQALIEDYYGYNLTTYNTIGELAEQTQRLSTELSELIATGNQLITREFIEIKKRYYREFITKLSREEDFLGLKPGTILNPAMAVINDLLLYAALEIEMPFANKLALLDDSMYLGILRKDAQKEINALQALDPADHEHAFQLAIKQDKLAFLDQQKAAHLEKAESETKSRLLELQFNVYLRDHLQNTQMKKPIVDEYAAAILAEYEKLPTKKNPGQLKYFLATFEKNNVANYLLVNEAYQMLVQFSAKLPKQHSDVKNEIKTITDVLIDADKPIGARANHFNSLPNNSDFINKLTLVDDGLSFLQRIVQLVQRFIASVQAHIHFREAWRENVMHQSIDNIQKLIDRKPHVEVEEEEDDEEDEDEFRPAP